VPGSKNTEYRLLLNWLPTGTCWVAMASRSAWIADWLIVSLKTQTLGPKVVVTASGHRLAAAAGAAAGDEPAAGAALAGAAASPATASAAARMRGGRSSGLANRRMGAPHCAHLGKDSAEM